MQKKTIDIVIPARFGSTRFPGKTITRIQGKPLILFVLQRSSMVNGIRNIIVATDDTRIFEIVDSFGFQVVMTSKDHKCGTDRIAEVAKDLDADIIINIQGDEPLIEPRAVETIIKNMVKHKDVQMATLITNLKPEDYDNPNAVKVVKDKNDFALYFSRSLIPYPRNKSDINHYKHIGLYGYRKDFLLKFVKMEQTPLEKVESLEQLRALENGYKIKLVYTDYDSIGVDTPEDLERVKKILAEKGDL